MLTARDRDPLALPREEIDENGVVAPRRPSSGVRLRLNRAWFAHNVQKPTTGRARGGPRHAEHERTALPAEEQPALPRDESARSR